MIRDTQAASHWWNERAALQSQPVGEWLKEHDALCDHVDSIIRTGGIGNTSALRDHARRIEGET